MVVPCRGGLFIITGQCIFVFTANITMTTLLAAEVQRGAHGVPVANLNISVIGCNGDD